MKPDAYSKYVKAYYVCVSRRRSRRIVKKLIRLADRRNKMLLIPADDLVAHIADENYNKLSNYYILPNVNSTQGELARMMNKDVQKHLAKKAGLPVLNSCVIKAYKGEFEIPSTVTYPCFIKPNVSRNSSKGRMRKCETEQELVEHLTNFSQRKEIEMLVEDFVDIDKEYSILGVSTKAGVIGPGYFVAEEGGQLEHRGVAVVGRTLPCSEEQKLIDDILKFISTLKFDGLYDVDLIKTTNGKMYFVELNMRFGASGYAFSEGGANMPGMFADYMFFNKPIDKNCKVLETGKTFVSEKVLIEEYMKGRISKKAFKDYMQGVDIYFIKSDDDPNPFLHFKKFYPIATIMKGLYKIKEFKQSKAENDE
jgi:predicted ATP-grasp superfamily ATP-dependent carboligase